MDGEHNGLTLEGLAHRLEALERENAERLESLERENERMRSENAELRDEVAALRGSGTRRDELGKLRGSEMRRTGAPVSESGAESEGQVSRRWLLSKAGAAVVGTMAAGTLMLQDAREAKAEQFEVVYTHQVNSFNETGDKAVWATTNNSSNPAVVGKNFGSGPGVQGTSDDTGGTGVEGFSEGAGSTGVKGTGKYYGVRGDSSQAGVFSGVFGRNPNGTGVRGVGGEIGVVGKGKNGLYGESSTPGDWAAVVGRNTAQGVGVHGESLTGYGVRGVGTVGVHGKSSEARWSSVWGEHTGAGYGVSGTAKGSSTAGVLGRNPSGYGGQFEGGKAQLRLLPGGTAGSPTTGSHVKGEIYMDKAAALWVCVAGGTPGTWRKVTTS